MVASQLDMAQRPAQNVILWNGTPAPIAAGPPSPNGSASTVPRRASLGHVARPSSKPSGETVPEPATTAGKRRTSIDGSGSELPAGTSVGTAGVAQQTGPPGDVPSTSRLEAAAVRLTNLERTRKRCAPLRIDNRLTRAARAHSRDMATRNFFGHSSPHGGTPWDRMARAGYPNSAAENIARGYETAEQAVRGWMTNSGHRRNILNCQITSVGVGVAYGSGDTWWTQDFGYS